MADPLVLIVDDEDLVRALLTRWLTRWNYRVTEAASADAAIEAMAADPAKVVVRSRAYAPVSTPA
ncbi:MAG: hypothetical protein A3I61_14105 [Acidobacteria bacterium RIFCSPLOWO2_02_FULL_68_18]|nr:MAG: hypothetical protein A3I61_14105 [Acidobacteria bacterium RIFCSPLOWO2_02_FULL_68_18]OFW50015.1 MAG: hypothetical protein A3G77_08845 [Acidobacteria bacterium RIFCSPLOWO2_12_FULL_68_19]